MSLVAREQILNPSEMSGLLREASFAVHEVKDIQPLIDRIAQARIVMLGESTHGTEEFYSWRRLISQWLITKHDFDYIVVEADWPDAWKINQYIQGVAQEDSARECVERLHRWPTWMWANTEVVRLAEWLRSHNAKLPAERRAGFFGLDVYSIFQSMNEVLRYLEETNPFLARRAKRHYACFDQFGGDEFKYARSTLRLPEGCANAVTQVLQDLIQSRRGSDQGMDQLSAEQNARLVKNAERYYRAMIRGDVESWNLRDGHMLETLDSLLEQGGRSRKLIVWAHNTHIGDYRATDMVDDGYVNLGGLAREKYGEESVALVGLGTSEGEVIAARAWEGPLQILKVPPARPSSCEGVYREVSHQLGSAMITSIFKRRHRQGLLATRLGQRAIGVVYDPEHERGNFVPTSLPERYDAFLHFERTHALQPLILPFRRDEIPETWPAGS